MKKKLSVAALALLSVVGISGCGTSEGVTTKDGSPEYAVVVTVDLGNGESVLCVKARNSISCDWDNKVEVHQ